MHVILYTGIWGCTLQNHVIPKVRLRLIFYLYFPPLFSRFKNSYWGYPAHPQDWRNTSLLPEWWFSHWRPGCFDGPHQVQFSWACASFVQSSCYRQVHICVYFHLWDYRWEWRISFMLLPNPHLYRWLGNRRGTEEKLKIWQDIHGHKLLCSQLLCSRLYRVLRWEPII